MSPSFTAAGMLARLLIDSHEELSSLAHVVRGAGCELYVADGEERRFRCPEAAMRFALHGGEALAADTLTDGVTQCISPLRDATGEALAMLEIDAPFDEEATRPSPLLSVLLTTTTRSVEERAFRKLHRRDWVVALTARSKESAGMLLAVDTSQRIVAADRVALAEFSSHRLDNASLWTVFTGDQAAFRVRNCGDVPVVLFDAIDGQEYAALVTPPDAPARLWKESDAVDVHSRPRLHTVSHQHLVKPTVRFRGGLTLRVQQRIRDYVDAHLDNRIDIEALANLASLSPSHFSRQFKQSVGLTPHNYVMQRRLARAQKLIATTELPLSSIALATGFADQAHFSRCFREEVGMSPRNYRWMQSDEVAVAS